MLGMPLYDQLFPYQKEGAAWLTTKRWALLADEMGLGKSAQAIVAADKIRAKRILVICPAVARLQWSREFDRFSHIKREFVLVTSTKTVFNKSTDSIVISFDLCSRLSDNILGFFDLVIIDEGHYLKSIHTKRTSAIFGKKGIIHEQTRTRSEKNGSDECGSANQGGARIWVLSGTPAPNHAGELWPLLYTFGATGLGYEDWIQRFCNVAPSVFGKGLQITGTKRAGIPELRSILAKVILRRTKDEVGHMLPKIFYSNVVVEEGKVDLEMESSFAQYIFPTNRVAELEALLKHQVQTVNEAINTNSIEALKGLAKSVATLRRYIGIQKVEKTAELVASELDAKLYDKIVIFAIHRDVIEGLRVRLADYSPLTLYGGTRFDSANKHIDKFQNFGKFKVFIGNITACGIAINLTASHNVLMIEQEWTPAANAQAVARCHRHGQTKPVNVRMVGLANSLDERISKILKRKTEELTEIFDGGTPAQTFEDLL